MVFGESEGFEPPVAWLLIRCAAVQAVVANVIAVGASSDNVSRFCGLLVGLSGTTRTRPLEMSWPNARNKTFWVVEETVRNLGLRILSQEGNVFRGLLEITSSVSLKHENIYYTGRIK